MAPHEHRKKWLIYLLWALVLALALAGIWWYYSRKIDQLDRELDRVFVASGLCVKETDMKHTISTTDYEPPVIPCSGFTPEGPSGHHHPID